MDPRLLLKLEEVLNAFSDLLNEIRKMPSSRAQLEEHHSSIFSRNGLRYSEVRKFVLQMRRDLYTFKEIESSIKTQWPNDPNHWVSKSALGRFWLRVRTGRLKEFGIE